MASLDRSRPYASVYNDDLGRFYEQDGQFFIASGDPWVDPQGRAPARKTAAAAAAPAADDQLAAQMAGA